MSHMLRQHRDVADYLTGGHRSEHFGLRMTSTRGLRFPWVKGGAALLRRTLYPAEGSWTYCGLATPNDTTIANYKGYAHSPNQAYEYTAVTILGNGFISRMSQPVRLDFDATSTLIQPLMPNAPIHVVAVPIAAGKVRVSFEYDDYGQGGPPTDFQVFEGATAAAINYAAPLGTVPASALQRLYSFDTAAFADLSVHVFGVRGRNSSGVAELNTTATQPLQARALAPVDAIKPQRAFNARRSRLVG